MKIALTTFLTFIPLAVSWSIYAQDSLMLKTGKMIPFVKLYQYEDSIELKMPYSKKWVSYASEDVFGYYDILNDQSYYLMANPEKNDYDLSHIFLERTTVGTINMYVDNSRDYKMYLSKNNKTYLIYQTLESQSENNMRVETLKELVMDDDKSVKYMGSQEFKFKPREIELVINQYNQRNFIGGAFSTDARITKRLFLYRTKFQKKKGPIRVWLNGTPHKLYIEDFILLNVPVNYASQITISDGSISTERIVSASIAEQYYEVLYDVKTEGYILDPKSGSELHFEFNRIKERIEKNANK